MKDIGGNMQILKKTRTVCTINQCAGCMACVDVCPCNAISVVDSKKYLNAIIDSKRCVQCNACHFVCQQNHPADFREPKSWLQGWGDEKIRATSSSGGFGQAVMKAALQNNFYVAACQFRDGDFRFGLINDENEVAAYVGSKYVKSNPVGIYKKVKNKLTQDKKVLFIGLPCQVSSMRNFVRNHKNLYTIDLVCHGTPSVRLLRESMKEYGQSLTDIQSICFRNHDYFAIKSQPINILPTGVQDCYTRAFLRGVCYTENCYSCQYACQRRVGDLTLGDSWGTEMKEELHKGISLILCQTDKGRELLDIVDFQFFPVDKQKSVEMNHQLNYPTPMPKTREKFFLRLENGTPFNHAVAMLYPKAYIKQMIKKNLIHLKLYL